MKLFDSSYLSKVFSGTPKGRGSESEFYLLDEKNIKDKDIIKNNIKFGLKIIRNAGLMGLRSPEYGRDIAYERQLKLFNVGLAPEPFECVDIPVDIFSDDGDTGEIETKTFYGYITEAVDVFVPISYGRENLPEYVEQDRINQLINQAYLDVDRVGFLKRVGDATDNLWNFTDFCRNNIGLKNGEMVVIDFGSK